MNAEASRIRRSKRTWVVMRGNYAKRRGSMWFDVFSPYATLFGAQLEPVGAW
jgi:hypothetical protein